LLLPIAAHGYKRQLAQLLRCFNKDILQLHCNIQFLLAIEIPAKPPKAASTIAPTASESPTS